MLNCLFCGGLIIRGRFALIRSYARVECAAGANWGHMAGDWLSTYLIKPCVFCVFYENDRSETSQARHIQLAKTFLKPCFYSCLNARRAQTWAHGWQLCGPGLSKYRIKPCVFVYVMKMTTQKLHKHNTSNLQTNLLKPSFYWCIECAAGSKLRAHGGQLWCQLVKIHNKSLRFCVLCEITTQKLHKHNTCNLQKNIIKYYFYLSFECAAGKKWGHMAGNWWCRLVSIPYKTLCFLCTVWKWQCRNITSATHQTCKKTHKTLFLFMFWNAWRAQLETRGGQLVVPACQNTL